MNAKYTGVEPQIVIDKIEMGEIGNVYVLSAKEVLYGMRALACECEDRLRELSKWRRESLQNAKQRIIPSPNNFSDYR